jgi:hypothetical protein
LRIVTRELATSKLGVVGIPEFRWMKHVARTGIGNAYKILVREQEKIYSEDLGVDGRIILKLIYMKQGVRM